MLGGGSSRYPFTAAQWQELEHQALFFKFMVSGIPIPPDLIFSINGKRSQQPQHIGWTCFQMGLSNHKIDPEPSRCRRTDGKKWRCSRQAFGDSKYCERHMHRGKSRSTRNKPLESNNTNDNKPPPPLLHLQTFPSKSALESAGTQSNLSSSLTTCEMTHKPVKDSNFLTFLGIDSGWNQHKKVACDLSRDDESCVVERNEKRQRRTMYHQFIEESPPQEKTDSWLNLVI
uniref:Growth-regulating factor n=1 Tax=Kalanchoe fedtschenkoi TaxID=63787 RepID=A0A7N0VM40_KALFE